MVEGVSRSTDPCIIDAARRAYVECKVDGAMSHLRLPDDVRDFIRTTLIERALEDPHLSELVRIATRLGSHDEPVRGR
jgi:hypothetical protein